MALNLTEATDRLAKIRTAIDTILEKGQSYTIEGRQYNRATLFRLREMERDAEREVKRFQRGGGIRVRYGTPQS